MKSLFDSRIWMAIWGVLMALTWLIPNHYPPWAGFHADAWMACVALLGAVPICVKLKDSVEWHGVPSLVLLLICIPWIQYALNMLPFASQAWLSSAYLFGFLLALLVGARSERAFPFRLIDAIFAAIVFSAIASVGLSLGAWLDVLNMGMDGFLSMGYYGGRHYANLGQPNLLATLVIWGLLGCLWGYVRGVIAAPVLLVACMYLVLGLTLTQSRMAYVACGSLLLIVWWRRRYWRSMWVPYGALFVFLFYLFAPRILSFVDSTILFAVQDTQYIRPVMQGELRFSVWKLFWDAALQRPWFGYGWTEVVGAQIEVAQNYPSLGGMFGHSHNIALDLIVWVGIPIGVTVFLCAIYWLWQRMVAIKCQEDLILLMIVVSVGVHSMFEYPLHYAYFLIPTGMVIGSLDVRLGGVTVFKSSRWTLGVLLLCAGLLLGQIVRDYLNVQNSYNAWRFERAGIAYPDKNAKKIPDVQMLTQYKYWFEMIRTQPFEGMTASELMLREQVTRAYPSPGAIFELAIAYGKNSQMEKSQLWLSKLCKLSSAQECAAMHAAWDYLQKNDSELGALIWTHGRVE